MSIHCFMKTLKKLYAEEVEKDIKEIAHKKFNDLLKITTCIKDNEICGWDVRYDETHGFPISLKTHENIDFTHPLDNWSKWVQVVFEDELAIRYDARMLDEEYPKQELKPEPEIHITFRKYLESTIHHSSCWKKALIEIEIARLPEALKNL